jgi:hypothetical protein
VAAFPYALMFMLTLVAGAIIVLCVLTYAMHCLLVVVRDTAAGNDEVIWPAEPFQDWAGDALRLVGVILIWLAPVGVLARALRHVWLPDDPGLRFLLLAVPGLWLFFPVALLSSLSGSSRWFVFRPVVVWNLLRVAPAAFAVYVLSAFLAAAVAALGYAVIASGKIIVAPPAAAGTAAALLIYARLLGRLAWKMGQLPSSVRKPTKKARPKAGVAEAPDPWAAPDEPITPEETDPEWEKTPYGRKRRRVKGYGLAREEPPQPQPEVVPDEGYTPLDMAPASSITERPPLPEPPDFDRRIRKRPKRSAASKGSLFGGVFTFPGYGPTRTPWLLLSLGFLAVSGAAYALVSLYAVLYKDG